MLRVPLLPGNRLGGRAQASEPQVSMAGRRLREVSLLGRAEVVEQEPDRRGWVSGPAFPAPESQGSRPEEVERELGPAGEREREPEVGSVPVKQGQPGVVGLGLEGL